MKGFFTRMDSYMFLNFMWSLHYNSAKWTSKFLITKFDGLCLQQIKKKIDRNLLNLKILSNLISKNLNLFYKWCLVTWLSRWCFTANDCEQYKQVYGLSPVWVRMWRFIWSFFFITLLQHGQANWFGPSLIGWICKQ